MGSTPRSSPNRVLAFARSLTGKMIVLRPSVMGTPLLSCHTGFLSHRRTRAGHGHDIPRRENATDERAHRGQPRMVCRFATVDGTIVAIDMPADPEHISGMDLVA